jgi:hypothetical protein
MRMPKRICLICFTSIEKRDRPQRERAIAGETLVEIRCGVLVAMMIEISDPSIMRFAVAAREYGAELNDREIQQTVADLHRTHSAPGSSAPTVIQD